MKKPNNDFGLDFDKLDVEEQKNYKKILSNESFREAETKSN